MSAQVRDMTKGSPAKLILLFAVPLMLGNIFQQLYTMVDTIVVGQVAGVQLAARWLLVLLNTPDNIIGMSLIYLRIVFCGIPIVAAYNIFASVLRALGNSRTPLIAMIIAAFINVVLDLIFVAGFNWGVAGAALATVTAQAFSAFFWFSGSEKYSFVHSSKFAISIMIYTSPLIFMSDYLLL